MDRPRLLVLLGASLLTLGSRLPWMSVPILFGVNGPANEAIEMGWADNGLITVAIGLILFLGVLFLKGKAGRRYSIPGAVLAAMAIFVVAGCFQRILQIDPAAGFFAATDVGIYVTLIGAVVALVGALGKVPLPRSGQDTAPISGFS